MKHITQTVHKPHTSWWQAALYWVWVSALALLLACLTALQEVRAQAGVGG